MKSNYKICLTKDELDILIRSTEWASEEYWKTKHPEQCIKVSDLNKRLIDCKMRGLSNAIKTKKEDK